MYSRGLKIILAVMAIGTSSFAAPKAYDPNIVEGFSKPDCPWMKKTDVRANSAKYDRQLVKNLEVKGKYQSTK